MPLYEYSCPNCKLKFELLRPINQVDETAPCPRCHNDAKRVFSTFAAFKGIKEGWAPVAGCNPCGTCSAITCDTCH